jgi:hypothetical protein
VAVEVGIAVTGEVLAARQHAALVKPFCECERVLDDGARRISERAIANHGVEWVRVDVEDWREV